MQTFPEFMLNYVFKAIDDGGTTRDFRLSTGPTRAGAVRVAAPWGETLWFQPVKAACACVGCGRRFDMERQYAPCHGGRPHRWVDAAEPHVDQAELAVPIPWEELRAAWAAQLAARPGQLVPALQKA